MEAPRGEEKKGVNDASFLAPATLWFSEQTFLKKRNKVSSRFSGTGWGPGWVTRDASLRLYSFRDALIQVDRSPRYSVSMGIRLPEIRKKLEHPFEPPGLSLISPRGSGGREPEEGARCPSSVLFSVALPTNTYNSMLSCLLEQWSCELGDVICQGLTHSVLHVAQTDRTPDILAALHAIWGLQPTPKPLQRVGRRWRGPLNLCSALRRTIQRFPSFPCCLFFPASENFHVTHRKGKITYFSLEEVAEPAFRESGWRRVSKRIESAVQDIQVFLHSKL